ncbi:hypothetical protein E2C01_029125 [Portunus trituberculatus]|uniref:Uncharacterized protein n=1 Tax=Portunus trituberculatus TaxID=210409 RepID=A0A5B7ER56_PORTR|nr:hypothetical protein [Portunus trituberculatus]
MKSGHREPRATRKCKPTLSCLPSCLPVMSQRVEFAEKRDAVANTPPEARQAQAEKVNGEKKT